MLWYENFLNTCTWKSFFANCLKIWIFWISTILSDSQLLNTSWLIWVTFFGILICFIDEYENALSSIIWSSVLSGISTISRDLHPKNARRPIFLTWEGIEILFILEWSNAFFSIVRSFESEGKSTCWSFWQLLNAYGPIISTELGIVTVFISLIQKQEHQNLLCLVLIFHKWFCRYMK